MISSGKSTAPRSRNTASSSTFTSESATAKHVMAFCSASDNAFAGAALRAAKCGVAPWASSASITSMARAFSALAFLGKPSRASRRRRAAPLSVVTSFAAARQASMSSASSEVWAESCFDPPDCAAANAALWASASSNGPGTASATFAIIVRFNAPMALSTLAATTS